MFREMSHAKNTYEKLNALRVNGNATVSVDPELKTSFEVDGKEPLLVNAKDFYAKYTQEDIDKVVNGLKENKNIIRKGKEDLKVKKEKNVLETLVKILDKSADEAIENINSSSRLKKGLKFFMIGSGAIAMLTASVTAVAGGAIFVTIILTAGGFLLILDGTRRLFFSNNWSRIYNYYRCD